MTVAAAFRFPSPQPASGLAQRHLSTAYSTLANRQIHSI
jgi:hypothetical protein